MANQVLEQIKKTKKVETKTKEGKKKRMRQLTDIIGRIDDYIEASDYNALLKQKELAKKELEDLADKVIAKADESTVVKGNTHINEIGPKANKTEIKSMSAAIAAMRKAVGPKGLLEFIKLPLGEMNKYLNPEQMKKLTKTERVGHRSMKIQRYK